MLRKTLINLKIAMHGQIQGLLVFTPLGEMISLIKYSLSCLLYFTYYLAVIFTWVPCLTPKFGAHNRKINLHKFPRMSDQKRIKCVYLAILFQIIIHWRSKHVKYN